MIMVAQSSMYSSPLQQAIDRHPLTVTPETPLVDVLKLMSKLHNSCALPNLNTSENEQLDPSILSNQETVTSVLVVKNIPVDQEQKYNSQSPLLGIFTASDLVKLIATDRFNNLQNLSEDVHVSEVMTSNVITLKESDDQDLFTALSLFRKHKVSHLPVLDSKGEIVGVVTPEKIRQVLQPSNILRLRRVNEVKNDSVTVTIPGTASLLKVSQLMAENKVNSVIITQKKKVQTQSIEKPLGIIANDDIAQAYFLDMDLGKIRYCEQGGVNFISSRASMS